MVTARLATLRKIRLTQYRNYPSAAFTFSAPIVCITGSNGSGKTNLLDAIYYLCYTKSYFTATQQNSAQQGFDGFRIEGVFEHATDGFEEIVCKWKAGKKEVFHDDVPYEKVTDHIGRYAAVMIAPDDLEIVNGGSDVRRKWMDGILCQTDKTYFDHLLQYQRVLIQRNAWLKMYGLNPPSATAELEYYNAQLAFLGKYLHDGRDRFVREFLPLLEEFYRKLSSGMECISLHYQSDQYAQPLLQALEASMHNDCRLQRTTRGSHKDDLTFVFDGKDLKTFGSQGQKKTYLFALKLAQHAFLTNQLHFSPILLLDDIFEKLDQQRMEALLRILEGGAFEQVFLTDTHANRVSAAFGQTDKLQFVEPGQNL